MGLPPFQGVPGELGGQFQSELGFAWYGIRALMVEKDIAMNRMNFRFIVSLVIPGSMLLFPIPGVMAQCTGTWTKRTPVNSPSARLNPGMAYDSRRSVTVLFGGYTGAENAETWEWDGASWSQKSPGASPSGRERFMLAYDSKRGVTVLYGGSTGGGESNETWEWDGTNWTQSSPATAPPARYGAAMAYDSVRGVCVLFGGYGGGALKSETWEWDGTNWSIREPATNPGGQTDISMTFDSIRGVCVLLYGDTWEWDGTNWSSHTLVTAPQTRNYGGQSFDSWRGVTVLFAGFSIAVGGLNDTWEWAGSTWVQRMPTMPPSKRDGHAMAFDSARGVTVMFGGETGGGSINETWEWAGPGAGVSIQPTDQSVADGASAMFSITAVGDALTYRWRKNGTPVSDGGALSGATTSSLTINPATASNIGAYDCLVSNTCGTVLSRAAALSIDPCKTRSSAGDCNANGILDSCEITADPSLDANGNGILDSCETPSAKACGTCGAGATTVTPVALLAFAASVRRRRK